jgi:hypothetical protein
MSAPRVATREFVPIDRLLVEYERRCEALERENAQVRDFLIEAVDLIASETVGVRARAFLEKVQLARVL